MRLSVLALLPFLSFCQVKPELEIRVIYDNTSARSGVKEDWGYSAVVTFRGRRLLFDSGTKPELFLENLAKLQVAPQSIEKAMISHEHVDHRNGIYLLWPLHKSLPVHFLESFEKPAWQAAEQIGMKPVAVTGPQELLPGMWTSGTIEGNPNEQSLSIETSKGLVMMVGCSHPGIVKMVKTVEAQRRRESIRLLIGGFHMYQQDRERILGQIAELRGLKVGGIRPAHCTGELAHGLFKAEWKESYGTAGAGNVITLD